MSSSGSEFQYSATVEAMFMDGKCVRKSVANYGPQLLEYTIALETYY